MDLRQAFVRELARGVGTMTELCATYDISRKTGYKWRARFEAGGDAALRDASRRPHGSPEAVAPALVEALVAARQRKPYWGARKLRAWLQRTQPTVAWPCRATIHTVLKRHGVVRTPRLRRHGPSLGTRPLTAAVHPNDVWTADFKGSFRLGSGVRCYPLTVRDLASRYTLRCDALLGETTVDTQARFARAFATYGLPRCIRTDNGSPFAGTGVARLSRLNIWWLHLGIQVERIALGRPDQNGAHERFHRDLKAQTARPPAADLAAQQRRFVAFVREYNHTRPHAALEDAVPAQHYHASPRPLPRHLPAWDYPPHWETRRVSASGCIGWRSHAPFVSEALAGETIAFDEVADGLWTLYLGRLPLARWDERAQQFRGLR
jgi:putative transposase